MSASEITQDDLEKIWSWNKDLPQSIERCVHEIFEEKAKEQPHAVAVCAWDGELQYGELNRLATKLATRLVDLGVEPGMLLPLCFEKSMWTTVAMLGVLKAGGGFVLLDISLPEKRLKSIVRQVNASLIVSSVSNQALAERLAPSVLPLCRSFYENLHSHPIRPLPSLCPSSVVCLVFTSGSTGTPKGSALTHRNYASALYHQAKDLGFSKDTRIFDFSSYSFDASISHTFTAFAAGGCLCVPPDEDRHNRLAQSITSLQANTVALTPSVVRLLRPEDTPTVRVVLFIGETLLLKDVEPWWGKVRVVTWIVDPDDANYLLPCGCTGELLLEGPLVGEGYLNEPEKTARAFIDSPVWLRRELPHRSGSRLYRTGDLVHYNEDGSLTFVGRKDTQIKIHGQRVELGEIEHCIQSYMTDVKHVVVDIIMSDINKTSLLAAFVQMKQSSSGAIAMFDIPKVVEEKLTAHLPRYMVPTAFFAIQDLPMTVSGKLDRRKLRQVGTSYFKQLREIQRHTTKPQPTSRVKLQLEEILSHILGIDPSLVGPDDNFFRLGGDSIAAMRIVAEAHKTGIEISAADILHSPFLGSMTSRARRAVHDGPKKISPFDLLDDNIDTALLHEIASQYHLDPATIEDAYACTPLQEGLLSISLKYTGEYIIQRTLEIHHSLKTEEFCCVWQEMVRNVPILRTRIVQSNSGLLQVVMNEKIMWTHTTGLSEYLEADRKRPMELGQPLARYAIVTDATGMHRVFVWTLHHAVYDGWSLPLMINMANRIYYGDPTLPPRHHFKAYVKYIQGQDADEMTQYWRNALSGCDCVTFPTLPSTTQRSAADNEITREMACLKARPRQVTASTMVRAAWALVTSRMTNSEEVVFGVTVSGRSAPISGIDEIIGPTIATVPVYVKIKRLQKVSDYLAAIQMQSTGMIPFEQAGLHRIAQTSPEAQHACRFQTLLIIQPEGKSQADNILGKWDDKSHPEWVNTFALAIEIQLGIGRVSARFDSNVIKPWVVQGMLERLEFVMRQLDEAGPDQTIAEIQTMTYRDLERVWKYNHTVPPPVKKFIHHIIEQEVQDRPDAVAIHSWDGKLTYSELDRLSTELAAELVKFAANAQLLGPDMLIPLCFEKSKWAVVSMLGVLKSGAGFVLLDPSLPELRLKEIVRQIGSRVLLSSRGNMELSCRLSDLVIRVGLNFPRVSKVATRLAKQFSPVSKIMYAVFTSGTTGAPKGVLVSHQNFCSVMHYQLEKLDFTKNSRVLDFASYAFDAAVHNVMATLAVGGCLCIPAESSRRDSLGDIMTTMQPTMANLTPTVARLLDPAVMPSLKTLILLGEPVTAHDVEKWRSHKVRVINTYGPAECTPISTINPDISCMEQAVSIGKGVGCVTWVVGPEDHCRLVPPGCTGELLLEGPLVGQGYLNDTKKTMEAFIHDPPWLLEGLHGQHRRHGNLYKTGDLVQVNEAGDLIFMGRKDSQVKIRGQRVELAEVEHHITEYLSMSRVAAEVIMPDGEGNATPMLVAFVLTDMNGTRTNGGQGPIPKVHPMAASIKETLAQKLPTYMVPTMLFSVPELPMTPTGKTDRRRLRELGRSLLMAETELVDDESPVDELIWETEQPAFALAENVYAMRPWWTQGTRIFQKNGRYQDAKLLLLGLDSVNMMELMFFILQEFHVKVSMQLLMDKSTTIRSLARSLSHSQDPQPAMSIDLMAEINRYDFEIAVAQEQSTSVTPITRNTKSMTVLLTGANGFLGTQILRQLLEHDQVNRVIGLVRGETQENTTQRTIDAAIKALWWTPRHARKLEVWRGDLSMPKFGLDPAHWDSLTDGKTIDAIIHNGAIVHWAKIYATLEAVNVTSTIELLRLAVALPDTRFVYITGGRGWDTEDEKEEDIARDLSAPDAIGYSQTKFVAEAVIRRAARRDRSESNRLIVVNPGLVIGTPTEGVSNADDYIWRLAAACIQIGAYNADEANVWLPISDAAATAKVVVHAALGANAGIIGERDADGMAWQDFWRILEDLGYCLETKPSAEWRAAMRADIEAGRETHPLWPLAHMIEARTLKEDSWLGKRGNISLRLKNAVIKSVEFLVRVGFLPMPAGRGGEATQGTHYGPFLRSAS